MKTILVLLLAGIAIHANRLADSAAALKPGQWKAFETDLGASMVSNGAGYMFDFGTQAEWDPGTKRIMYMGESHGGSGGLATVIMYDAESDHWYNIPTPREPQVSANRMGHSYDQNTFVPQTGEYWYSTYVEDPGRPGEAVYKYSFARNDWDTVQCVWPEQPYTNFVYAGAMQYFPEINSLVQFSGYNRNRGSVALLGDTLRWRGIAGDKVVGFYHTFMEHIPQYHVMLIFSEMGSWLMDTSLTMTPLFPPFTGDLTRNKAAEDPVTGTLLVQETDGNRRLFAYSVPDNRYQELPVEPAGIFNTSLPIAHVITTIPEYGVIMMIRAEAPRVLLYKYTSWNDTLPVQSLRITSEDTVIEEYMNTALTVTAAYAGDLVDTVTNSCFFRSLDSTRIQVLPGGRLHTLNSGPARVEVMKRNARGMAVDTITITVTPSTAALQAVALAAQRLSIMTGDAYWIAASGRFQRGAENFTRPLDTALTWTSSNPVAAAVDDWGGVIALMPGTTVIRAINGDKGDSCVVTVMSKPSFIRRVNFQPSGLPFSYGWLADSGAAYTAARTLGWVNPQAMEAHDSALGGNYLLKSIVKTTTMKRVFRVDCPNNGYIIKYAVGDNRNGGNDSLWQGARLLCGHSGASNLIKTDTVTVTAGNLSLLVRGSFDYFVMISNEGIDINDVADDGGSAVPVKFENGGRGVLQYAPTAAICITPNPFNPATAIRYHLGAEQSGFLAIHSIDGKKVHEWALSSGQGVVTWNASENASGLYLCRLKTKAGKTYIHPLILAK